jgi:putative protein-disulfide isomerase
MEPVIAPLPALPGSPLPVLVYGFDPLCGWCFGFRPVIEGLLRALDGKVRWEVMCGGLVTGSRERPIREMAAFQRRGMAAVELRIPARFGAAFREILARGDWVSRSEPGCRAVLWAERIAGPVAAIRLGGELCRLFYEDGRLPDDAETVRDVARAAGLDAAEFVASWSSPEAREVAAQRMAAAREEGVTTYPSLFLRTPEGLLTVAEGFLPLDEVLRRIDRGLLAFPAPGG